VLKSRVRYKVLAVYIDGASEDQYQNPAAFHFLQCFLK
jgi:hypothetical protein